MELFKKILCPIDFSDISLRALSTATELAHQFDGELLVLLVVAPLVTAPDFAALTIPGMVPSDEERKAEALNDLQEIVAENTPVDVPVRCQVRLGDAAEEIVAAAADADLVVISTHGLTGWRHLLFGSVAECVVRTAPCPVLTLRATPATVKAGKSPIHQHSYWHDPEDVCLATGKGRERVQA